MTSPEFSRKVRRAKRLSKQTTSTEDEIHVRIVGELATAGVAFFHVANERRTSQREGAKLKRMGVSPGVPDIVIVTPPPCGGYVAAALELKREGGRPTKEQLHWLGVMRSAEWATAVVYGLDDARRQLTEWGYL